MAAGHGGGGRGALLPVVPTESWMPGGRGLFSQDREDVLFTKAWLHFAFFNLTLAGAERTSTIFERRDEFL